MTGGLERCLTWMLCSLLAWSPVVSASRDGSDSLGGTDWAGDIDDLETPGRLTPSSNHSLQVLVSSVASMQAARPERGALPATDLLQSVREAMHGTPDRASAGRLAKQILNVDWAASGIEPLDALRLKSALMGGDSAASLQLVDHISAALRPPRAQQLEPSGSQQPGGVQQGERPFNEDTSLQMKIASLRLLSNMPQASNSKTVPSAHTVPIGDIEQAFDSKKASAAQRASTGDVEQVASVATASSHRQKLAAGSRHKHSVAKAAAASSHRHTRAARSRRTDRRQRRQQRRHEHAKRVDSHIGKSTGWARGGLKVSGLAQELANTQKRASARKPEEKMAEALNEEKMKLIQDMKEMDSAMREGDTASVKRLSAETKKEELRLEADEKEEDADLEVSTTTSVEPEEGEEESTTRESEEVATTTGDLDTPEMSKREEHDIDEEDFEHSEDPESDNDKDGEREKDDGEGQEDHPDVEDEDRGEGQSDHDEPVGAVQKECRVDEKGKPESILHQLQACTKSLNNFAQETQKGHARSKRDNEALHEEMRKVTKMLAILLDSQKSEKAFSDDQNGALKYLMGQLEKTNKEIAILPEGSARGASDRSEGEEDEEHGLE